MRTAQFLKYATFGVLLAGIWLARKLAEPSSLEFWLIIFAVFVFFLILRLLAIMGQLLYEIRNDALRLLGNIERAVYYSNSLVKETRDLLESGQSDKVKP